MFQNTILFQLQSYEKRCAQVGCIKISYRYKVDLQHYFRVILSNKLLFLSLSSPFFVDSTDLIDVRVRKALLLYCYLFAGINWIR